MECPNCQSTNRDDARFCDNCGVKLELECPACGALGPLGKNFCRACGHKFAEPDAETAARERQETPDAGTVRPAPESVTGRLRRPRSAVEGERKQVTVLFADIKGSTELVEAMDPEQVAKRMDPVLNAMMDAVHKHAGTVNKVQGDGIMALFGAPVAQEDHAVRGCAAALDMQASIAEMVDQGVIIRVGLNSGEVVVRAIGNDLSMDYDATGSTVHLAARMEQMAAPGTVLATADTARLARGYIETRSLGPTDVKGMSDPVEAHEIVGRSRARSRWDVMARRGLTQFVGRETAMAELSRACEQAAAGSGQIVAIVGEAGNGKSRLVHEFVHSETTQGWAIRTTGAVPQGGATPYLPLSGLLRSLFGIEDQDTHSVMVEKIERNIVDLDEELRVILPALHSVLDIPVVDEAWNSLEPPERRRRILDGVKALTMRRSQALPLLMVFEDLHWLDAETQTVLDNLVDALSGARILLLVTYRPEYQHHWSSKSYYNRIRVDPLTDDSSKQLLSSLIGDDPGLEPMKRLITDRTAGTPLFLEETVRALIETRVLLGEPGDLRLAANIDDVVIPASVHAVLASRIDRLRPEHKDLLQNASVVGRNVPVSLLVVLLNLPVDVLRTRLDDLQAAEFLYESRVVPNHEYTFKHALTQDVAYGSVLMEKRRVLHARLVAIIENEYSERIEEHLERLAHHALSGEIWDKAVKYCRQAGVKAMQRSAHREAAQLLERLLEALNHLPETRETREQAIDVRLELRAAYGATGEVEKMFAHLREARRLAKDFDDPVRRAWADILSMSVIENQRDLDADDTWMDKAYEVAKAVDDQPLLGMSSMVRGMAFNQQGRFRKTLETLEPHAEDFAARLRHERFGTTATWSILCLKLAAVAHAQLGEHGDAHAMALECQKIAHESKRPFDLGFACWAEGSGLLRHGDVGAALPVLEQGLGHCQSDDTRILFPAMAPWLAFAYALSGRSQEAKALTEQAWDRLKSGNLFWMHIWAFAPVGWTLLELDLVQEAIAAAEHIESYAKSHRLRAIEIESLRLSGQALARQGPDQFDKAEERLRRATAASRECGMLPELGQGYFCLSELYANSGHEEKARCHQADALKLFRELGMTYWADRMQAAVTT